MHHYSRLSLVVTTLGILAQRRSSLNQRAQLEIICGFLHRLAVLVRRLPNHFVPLFVELPILVLQSVHPAPNAFHPDVVNCPTQSIIDQKLCSYTKTSTDNTSCIRSRSTASLTLTSNFSNRLLSWPFFRLMTERHGKRQTDKLYLNTNKYLKPIFLRENNKYLRKAFFRTFTGF